MLIVIVLVIPIVIVIGSTIMVYRKGLWAVVIASVIIGFDVAFTIETLTGFGRAIGAQGRGGPRPTDYDKFGADFLAGGILGFFILLALHFWFRSLKKSSNPLRCWLGIGSCTVASWIVWTTYLSESFR